MIIQFLQFFRLILQVVLAVDPMLMGTARVTTGPAPQCTRAAVTKATAAEEEGEGAMATPFILSRPITRMGSTSHHISAE